MLQQNDARQHAFSLKGWLMLNDTLNMTYVMPTNW